MTLAVLRSDLASRDLEELADFLAADSLSAADRFLETFDRSLALLAEFPNAGSPRLTRTPGLGGLRVWPVKGFESHLIFHRCEGDHLLVLRVLHAKRDIATILASESA
jgi:toxin ParE1/3/4